MKHAIYVLPLLALVPACSQSDSPSTEMEAAAEQLVDAVIESPDPNALGTYEPRNECSDQEGADAFLSALNAAVELRDTDLLVALSADDVKLGFGGEDGAANLRANLDSDAPNLWSDLEEVLKLGCAGNSQGGITMPYYFAQDTKGDPFEALIVTGKDVPMHAQPNETSSRLTTISWDEVELIPGEGPQAIKSGAGDDGSWKHVRTIGSDKFEGYIRSSELRSVIDYRLIASNRNGRWRITAFLAGD
ncbi:hypothetical protein GCM10009127_24680 [Alteraurantiacibacter aestuarii]|uniref:hypothetical protein n=1 Tax=Alteraurantiacibacter aestuarii TaxID=650004 RepID=UPI0031E253A0